MWVDGHWWMDFSYNALRHVKAGERPDHPGMISEDDFDQTIPLALLPSLFEAAMENGVYLHKMSGREEDLKIVHRLLDVVEKQSS